MDKELSTTSANYQGGLKTGYGDYTSSNSGKPGRRQKKRERPPVPLELLFKTVHHFFPKLTKKINQLADPRDPEKCVYSPAHLVWLGLLTFMTHLGSRRQMRYERESDDFASNFGILCGQWNLDCVADPDTLAYYAERMDIKEAESLSAYLFQRLIRMKALDAFRLEGYFTIALDGTQLFTFDYEPWTGCPHRELKNGNIQYFAYMLDAKLVTPNGMAITIASEMLTNEGNKKFDKQDCELKAFPRLAAKIKEFFPRTPFVLLLDGLYASQNVLRLTEKNHWKYFITFKEGSMPERFAETLELVKLQSHNSLIVENNSVRQSFAWVSELPIAEFNPSVIFCLEHDKSEEKSTNFVWLTNFKVRSANVVDLSNNGGRLRWKIENEGFRVLKTNGYEMKHAYSRHKNGMRIMYILMTIAHTINQLILKGSLIRSLARTFGSAKNFARRLSESIRCKLLTPADLVMPGQIRFIYESPATSPP